MDVKISWSTDNEHCAYNDLFGYHVSNIAGIYVLRSPLCGVSRHGSMEDAKAYAEVDLTGRVLRATGLQGV